MAITVPALHPSENQQALHWHGMGKELLWERCVLPCVNCSTFNVQFRQHIQYVYTANESYASQSQIRKRTTRSAKQEETAYVRPSSSLRAPSAPPAWRNPACRGRTRLQVRNMFTKIHLREEDRAVVPAIARRSDGKVLVVIRVRGCQMRVAFGELQRERRAVDVIHHASSVLLEDESLIYQLVIAG